jgi:hypothetical protein
MRTLASVLDAAVQRMASEVTLESEQPVIYKTARGSEAEQDVLERPALFDMLASAVSDELQVELMLGNAIEFVHDVQRVKWQVRAVPGADAMVVRAQRVSPMPTAIPLPDSDDISISAAESGAFGFGFEDDGLDPDFDLDSPPPPPRPAAPRPAVSTSPPASVPSKASAAASKLREPVPAPFESGTWALDDEDDELEVELEDAARAPTLSMPASESSANMQIELDEAAPTGPLSQFEIRRPPRTDAALVQHDAASEGVRGSDFLGVPADDDDGVLVPDGQGGLRRRSSAKLAALRAAQGRTQEIAPLASPRAETLRELSALRSTSDAETHRELAVQRRADSVASELDAGVLAFVLGHAGLVEQLAHTPHLVVLDHDQPDQLRARVQALPAGAFIVIRREDPSTLLGWILRRLEDGFRVLIETGARSGAGARRILLGTDASARAEAWLARHPQVVVEAGEGGPSLLPLEP